jgi:hemolysin activation/secretion protein
MLRSVALLLLLIARIAAGEQELPVDVPDFTPQPAQPGSVLPTLRIDPQNQSAALAAGLAVPVADIAISGNSVLSTAQLAAIADEYRQRALTLGDLYQLRDRLTAAYVAAGFVSSGAQLAEPPLIDGVVQIEIIEGRLDRVQVETDGRFRPEYFAERLRATGPVVNLHKLEERLQLFERDERIEQVAAQLLPGERRGLADLHLRVAETSPWRAEVQLANDLSPSIGAENLRLAASDLNPGGAGDRFDASTRVSEGLRDLSFDYSRPLAADERNLSLYWRGSRSDVIDEAFAALEIHSRSATAGVRYRQPLRRSRAEELAWSVALEHRRSESYLLGIGFSFSEGPEDGRARIVPLRLSLDWTQRDALQVLSASARLSVGLDAFDATAHAGDTPDGQFVALLTRAQWARRLEWLNATLIARGDVQLSDSSLLGMEQFSVGGANSVRGYRENTLVRDEGALASLELRIPLATESAGSWQFAPFLDAGYARHRGRETFGPRDISSAGLTIYWQSGAHFSARLALAKALRNIEPQGEEDWQDEGIHFALLARWP